MTNTVDPDETARYEPSHLDLQFAKVSDLVYGAEREKSTDSKLELFTFLWYGVRVSEYVV